MEVAEPEARREALRKPGDVDDIIGRKMRDRRHRVSREECGDVVFDQHDPARANDARNRPTAIERHRRGRRVLQNRGRKDDARGRTPNRTLEFRRNDSLRVDRNADEPHTGKFGETPETGVGDGLAEHRVSGTR